MIRPPPEANPTEGWAERHSVAALYFCEAHNLIAASNVEQTYFICGDYSQRTPCQVTRAFVIPVKVFDAPPTSDVDTVDGRVIRDLTS